MANKKEIRDLERRRDLFNDLINSALEYRTSKKGEREEHYNNYLVAKEGLVKLGVSKGCLDEFVRSNGYEIRRKTK